MRAKKKHLKHDVDTVYLCENKKKRELQKRRELSEQNGVDKYKLVIY